MSDAHRLHEAYIDGGVEAADSFAVERAAAVDGVCVVVLSGELDIAATSIVRRQVDEAAGLRGLVLDLSAVTFLDSSMLKELLRACAQLSRYDTRLILAGIAPSVRRVLDLTRTTELFSLADDRAAALAQLER